MQEVWESLATATKLHFEAEDLLRQKPQPDNWMRVYQHVPFLYVPMHGDGAKKLSFSGRCL